jgi:phosphoglycolate phosphatase
MAAAPLLVFDLDGTLIDTAPDLVDTLNVILTREGLPAVPFDTARTMIGGGARMLIERGLAAEGRSCSSDAVDRLYRDFVSHYGDHIADRSRPFPGLEGALDHLAEAGWRFAVCTNKLEGLSRQLLDALGLTQRFDAICGQDTFGVQKPHPDILLRTIRRAGGEPERAIMVGDSANDVHTARAATVPVIGVTFGYTDVPVAQLNPDRIIDDYAQLPSAVTELAGTWPRQI